MALSKIINGGVAASGIPSGGIIQVQKTQFTGTNNLSISAETNTILTDLTVNITPISTSSVIHLQSQIFLEFDDDTSLSWNHVFFFYRDTTKLGHPTAGSRPVGVSMATRTYPQENATSTPEIARFDYFDSPSSTSQITYKVGVMFKIAGSLYLNRTQADIDNISHERGVSFISATEIAG